MIKNKYRSIAHKKYNKEKEEYQQWEKLILDIKKKMVLTINDKTLYKKLENARLHLKLCVINLKAYKSEMSIRNKEYNKELNY